jgi:hypothetical protein
VNKPKKTQAAGSNRTATQHRPVRELKNDELAHARGGDGVVNTKLPQ